MSFEWFTGPDSEIWVYLDRVSIILSYIVVFSIIYGIVVLVKFFRRYRKIKTHMKKVDGTSPKPMALAISFGGSIKKPVEDYLNKHYTQSISIMDYSSEKEVTPQNIHDHIKKLLELKHDLQAEGVTELHLFIKGPVIFGALVGAMFDNWCNVKLYHNNRKGEYEEWAMLHAAKELSPDEQLAVQTAKMLEGKR
ncbi:MAG: SAVED domain-containing protein [Nitrospirae bacterium]|nr:SAVED domain-containing protein [Nitrospirota bacterium]